MSDGWTPPPWQPPPMPSPPPSQGPTVVAIVVGVVVGVSALLGISLAVLAGSFDDSNDEKTVEQTLTEQEQELADAMAADPEAAFASQQLTMTFNQDASDGLRRRVEREWRANPQLHLVFSLGADEVEAATGFGISGIAAWVDGEGVDEAEDFVCAYAGQPGIAMVGVDDTPCNTSSPTPPEVVIEVRVGPEVTPAHRETIRHALQDNGFYDDVALEGGTDEPGTWTLLRLSGYLPGAPYVCPKVAEFIGDPGVSLRETGPIDACPEL